MTSAPHDQACPAPRRVLLVDDHPVVREGLAGLINAEPDLRICGMAQDARQALEAVTTSSPELVVVDLMLRGSSGFDLIKDLVRQVPGLPLLILSIHDETLYAERVLRAGALGYVMKDEAMDTVLIAIRQVLRGEVYLSPRMLPRILRTLVKGPADTDAMPLRSLTDRELEVLQFLGQGYTTRQIADTLHVSVKTVEAHRAHIMEKLHLEGAPALIRYAAHWVPRADAL